MSMRTLRETGAFLEKIPATRRLNGGRLPWFRDVIAHGYFRIAYGILWGIVTGRIPDF
ncbi:MAG: HepT-like ribonuclease domain-containing protein [Methanoregula sp.]